MSRGCEKIFFHIVMKGPNSFTDEFCVSIRFSGRLYSSAAVKELNKVPCKKHYKAQCTSNTMKQIIALVETLTVLQTVFLRR